MTGVINKTARQLDLRGRDASGIVHVVPVSYTHLTLPTN